MISVDYEFYVQTFKGKMDEADFERLNVKASAYLDRVTFGRINDSLPEDVQQKVRLALCEVADTFLLNEQGGELQSETVGPWSRSYQTSGKTAEQLSYSAAAQYLANTGLLYRGCMCNDVSAHCDNL